MREYPKIVVNKKAERAARSGHPWVYGEEVVSKEACENGALADLYTEKRKWLGTGFYNDHSKILLRLISDNTNDRFDRLFWQRRIRYAIAYRKTVMGDDFSACRLIFGEADRFPGFTVDRFENVLVTEILCFGIDLLRETLYDLLIEELSAIGVRIDHIYERSTGALRQKEGLADRVGYYEKLPKGSGTVRICENGVYYDVDYENGQKTGFFLDQKYNRLSAAKIARGKNVLDCCTHTGAFALNCAKAGAMHVTAVDISEEALRMCRHNADLNGLTEKMDFRQADVFDFLKDLSGKKSDYDFIILDPPAFTKSTATVHNAYNGYKEINTRAMRLLGRGGYLATCSCSHFMTDPLFEQMLKEASNDAGISIRVIEFRHQAPDHPILFGVPETEYLKFYLLQVV